MSRFVVKAINLEMTKRPIIETEGVVYFLMSLSCRVLVRVWLHHVQLGRVHVWSVEPMPACLLILGSVDHVIRLDFLWSYSSLSRRLKTLVVY
jgi:hypothetical protein